MKSLIILSTIIVTYGASASNNTGTFCVTPAPLDYYWRDYRGGIPGDAIPGGLDKAGKPIYIGQALEIKRGLLPANIYMGKDEAVLSLNKKVHYVYTNIKILCGRYPERFSWIPTDTEKIQLITHCNLVSGGVDGEDQLNIGRINSNDEVVIGKVLRKPSSYPGLWVPCKQAEQKFDSFQVLAYNCDVPFDVRTGEVSP